MQGMNAFNSALSPIHMQATISQIDLSPSQGAEFSASAASPARAAATTRRSRRSTVSRAALTMVASLESPRRRIIRSSIISVATQSMIGPTDRRVMPVLAGIIPSHPVIAERAPRCAYGKRQLVGADRVAGPRKSAGASSDCCVIAT